MKKRRPGLRANLKQFTLLVVINAFVGGMLGMERSILSPLAESVFGISSQAAALSFIVAFGITKAIANLFTGLLMQRFGRKNMLLAGWVLALPIPFLLMYAPAWHWIIATNILLGAHQGIAWSAAVTMKMDIAGERDRGLAMGLNEFAGYFAIALTAFLTGWIADQYGLRPYPFYLGIFLSIGGLMGTWWWVQDTRDLVHDAAEQSRQTRLQHVFQDTTWRHRVLGATTLSGFVNNLNDGMIWGVLPVLLLGKGFGLSEMAFLAAIYPGVWGIGQLFTGRLADLVCKKRLIFWGMSLQGAALSGLAFSNSLLPIGLFLAVLGLGTALVYPTFLASVAAHTHPYDRAKSLGVFRFWRDLGYAAGALATGFLADRMGIPATFITVGVLTAATGVWAEARMYCEEKLPSEAAQAGNVV
jgi:MFS family permease